jgi:hypothetical protein
LPATFEPAAYEGPRSDSIRLIRLDSSYILLHIFVPIPVDVCTNVCDEIVTKEEDQKNNEWLNQQRAARDKEWQEFMQEQCEKSNSIDNHFNDEKDKLESQYAELENKMNHPPSP